MVSRGALPGAAVTLTPTRAHTASIAAPDNPGVSAGVDTGALVADASVGLGGGSTPLGLSRGLLPPPRPP